MKKGYMIGGLGTVLVLAAVFLAQGTPREVQVVRPAAQDLEVRMELTAEVLPQKVYSLTHSEGGRVAKLHFSEGDEVNSGDCILSLDDSHLQSAKEALLGQSLAVQSSAFALSEEEALQTRLLKTAQSAGCDPLLWEHVWKTEEEPAAAVSARAEPADAQARSQLASLETRLAACQMETGLTGTLLSLNVREGDLLAPGAVAAVVADTENFRVVSYVSENDLLKLREGMACSFTLPGEETACRGTVTSLGSALTEQMVYGTAEKLAPVVITPRTQQKFLPGSSVDVSVLLERAEQTLSLPLDALSAQNEVWVVTDANFLERRKVTTGLVGEERIQILSGLKPEDRVVLGPDTGLQEGERVRVHD